MEHAIIQAPRKGEVEEGRDVRWKTECKAIAVLEQNPPEVEGNLVYGEGGIQWERDERSVETRSGLQVAGGKELTPNLGGRTSE